MPDAESNASIMKTHESEMSDHTNKQLRTVCSTGTMSRHVVLSHTEIKHPVAVQTGIGLNEFYIVNQAGLIVQHREFKQMQ